MKHTNRCPWCGKIMNRHKDERKPLDKLDSSVPSRLRLARCGHCGHKYGQIPTFPYVIFNGIIAFLILVVSFSVIYELGISVWFALLPMIVVYYLFRTFTPYSKLDDRKKEVEVNPDLVCDVYFIETYDKIQCNRLYFFENDFDCFEPYMVASPIRFYNVKKNNNYAWCELLYMHEKNYKYIGKESCDLYDSNMKLVAKVKIILDSPDIQGEQNSEI